ncbi:3-deoxy-7-phosphoheptulonate synthase [Pigmentibacter sp. JX0631]|uniref:3-deoxy-7-phosphoheptulonate synthase n=1 Tax=Pigmentibacter sp. JX0631 TaxID=2976982 RepID=UPI00246919AD|nr:3-deoxy-7-phosphoheptulonate synthase [Pigmentibacter sp. JX0631]WGL59608.1 3-deoxy-7-phosphoheptulonate synthase [Pigmentibacter sp. JX0631]
MLFFDSIFQDNTKNSINSDYSCKNWNIETWKKFPILQQANFDKTNEYYKILNEIAQVKNFIEFDSLERIKQKLSAASLGHCFVLQTGDCAEQFSDCTKETVTKKLAEYKAQKEFLQKVILKEVLLIGRIAGQFAKPRSEELEKLNSELLPVYRGDIVNRPDKNLIARQHNFKNLKTAQKCAQKVHKLIQNYNKCDEIFTSHEALLLEYENCYTKYHAGFHKYYNSSTHFFWIGERTRQLNNAHIEYAKNLFNPIGIKISENINSEELISLINKINPLNESGKISLITRFGSNKVQKYLPPLIQAVKKNFFNVTWICDPMHGNTEQTIEKIKTRNLNNIQKEISLNMEIHGNENSILAGVHLETSEQFVTECYSENSNITISDVPKNYKSACDPRLNPDQTREILKIFSRLN